MIKNIATQAVYVADQNAAEDFWVNKVGFKVKTKHDMQNGYFWLEVGPENSESNLVLYPQSLMPDYKERRPSIVFACEDVHGMYQLLKTRGVNVGDEPIQMKWGKYATFVDLDNNEYLIKS